jgi:2-dehydropantoate 2-reductase
MPPIASALPSPPKIAVVGCGALGSFYGARLWRAGAETHFLLRSDYAVVARQGVRLRSVEGDFTARPHAARRPEEIGRCDLVVIGLKATANAEFPRLLPPLVGPATLVLTLQNGLGNEERLAEIFGPQNLLGGLCFVCLNRLEPGLIHHLAHGRILLGEYQRPPAPRTGAVADWFRRSGIPCDLTQNLARAHWEKLVWNIPFNGLGVAGCAGYEAVLRGGLLSGAKLGRCLPTDVLLADPRWLALVKELMLEVIRAARRLGFDLPDACVEENLERTRNMGPYYASTLLDFEHGRPLETESLFMEPLRRARKAGAECPRLEKLGQLLGHLQASRISGRVPG